MTSISKDNLHLILLPVLILLMVFQAGAQEDRIVGAELTFATKLGRIESLRDLAQRDLTDPAKLKAFKENRPEVVQNFFGRRHLESLAPGAQPNGVDPVRQDHVRRAVERIVEPFVNFEGINEDESGSGVPDVNGDVSDQYYIETVNSTLIRVYDLAGNQVGMTINANTIWNQVGLTSAGDPIILYDRTAGRWMMTEFPPSNRVLIAISDSEDPFGGWSAYAFSTPRFPDYPKYGIWPEAYVLTTNESGGGTVKFYFINREDLLTDADEIRIQRFEIPRFDEPSWQTATPVDWIGENLPDSAVGPMIVRINDDGWGDTGVDQVEIWEANLNWDNQEQSEVKLRALPSAPFDSDFCSVTGPGFACIPQPNGVGIDGIPWVIMHKVQLRVLDSTMTMVLNFTVDATGEDIAGIRWMEFRREVAEDWVLYQEGTFAPDDGLQRFMGGISIDSEGNIGLAYNVSSDTKHPSLRFTGRRYNDPLGVMTVREYEFATGSGSNTSDRFGDYASMSVDINDNFWYAGEYILANSDWASKIVGFKMAPDTNDLAAVALVSPVNAIDLGSEEVVEVNIENQGLAIQDSFLVGYVFENGTPVIDTVVLDSLSQDSVYTHAFSQTIDLSVIGSYELLVFCDLLDDENRSNDTLRLEPTKLSRFDAGVVDLEGISGTVCDSFTSLSLILANLGQDTLFSTDVISMVNDQDPDTTSWSGALAFGETALIDLELGDLVQGDNILTAFSIAPNGIPDQLNVNDTLHYVFQVQNALIQLFITTDNFPGETTWDVVDTEGNILYSGGPYEDEQTTYSTEMCLDTSRCYTFTIYDMFGDGITAQGVEGNYTIMNADGVLLGTLNDPDFGDSESNAFCGSFFCGMNSRAIVAHQTRPGLNNGVINIIATGAMPPIQFSITGGEEFQSSPIFNNLPPGEYAVYVKDATGCITLDTVELLACDISLMAEITGVSHPDSSDGSISVSISGQNGPAQFSINMGGSFQSSNMFTQLNDSTYTITVKDSVGCQVSADFTVDVISSTRVLSDAHFVRIYPNPSDGVFTFEVFGFSQNTEVPFDVLDSHGKVVNRGYSGTYNGVLKGIVSLRNQPDGIYFLRMRSEQFTNLYRLVKQK